MGNTIFFPLNSSRIQTESHRLKKSKFILVASSACVFAGCTSVTIHTEGKVSSNWYFGVPIINVDSETNSTLVETKSFGIVKSINTFNIGYMNELYFVSGKECELVLFNPNDLNINYLKDISQSICSIYIGDNYESN